MTDEPQFPYRKMVPLDRIGWRYRYQLFDGAKGCVLVESAGLCMDKCPKPLPTPKAAAAPAPKIKQAVVAPPAPVFKPAPAPPPAPSAHTSIASKEEKKSKAKNRKEIKPFDLYDMPAAMRAAGFKIAPILNQRWLDGRAYEAPLTFDSHGKQTAEGVFPADMVDTSTITLDWLLKYKDVLPHYDRLLLTIENDAAKAALIGNTGSPRGFTSFFADNPNFSGDLSVRKYCNNDLQKIHKQFQFQFEPVGAWAGFDMWSVKTNGMTDLMASLANFNFFAAVAHADIQQQRYHRYNTERGTVLCSRHIVTITHVFVYAKDSYSFYDNAHVSSQYLRHWNKNEGVVISPEALEAELITQTGKGLDFEAGNALFPPHPIDLGFKLLDRDIFSPVRNRDYVAWRKKQNRGGDFLIFSDFNRVKLEKPMTLDMGEKWTPTKY